MHVLQQGVGTRTRESHGMPCTKVREEALWGSEDLGGVSTQGVLDMWPDSDYDPWSHRYALTDKASSPCHHPRHPRHHRFHQDTCLHKESSRGSRGCKWSPRVKGPELLEPTC